MMVSTVAATENSLISPLLTAVSLSSPLKRKAEALVDEGSSSSPGTAHCELFGAEEEMQATRVLRASDREPGVAWDCSTVMNTEPEDGEILDTNGDDNADDSDSDDCSNIHTSSAKFFSEAVGIVDEDDVEDEMAVEEELFMQTLKEFETAPVEQLLKIIQQGEE
jgi:hypothetical protein